MTTWDPRAYLQFSEVRFRAGLDLLAHIPPGSYRTIYDLGCGTGHLTQIVAERFPGARVTGIDSSPEMLAEARRGFPGITFAKADISSWQPEDVPDLIISNAVLHWVPSRETLLQSLLRMLAPEGVLAVQVPRHFEMVSHSVLTEVVQQSAWPAVLEPLLVAPWASPETIWKLLAPDASKLDIWETVYLQVLEGQDAVLNFMRGSTLRPLLSALSAEDGTKFLATLAARLTTAYPPQATGQTLFPFRRFFLIARR
ncbi:MAG TPA: methyltransferase domain-containing protein [Candidatus Dormibacteraeota bacterium]|nr:methyltransferase domain-containing protein [Candidatus Dormibacteraeota bacterium]